MTADMKGAICCWRGPISAATASISVRLGRGAPWGGAQAGGTRECSASSAAAAEGRRTRTCDAACAALSAAQPTCVPDCAARFGSRVEARSKALPHLAVLRAERSLAPDRRSRGQTCPFEWCSRCCHPSRSLRERPSVAARALVGRSVARASTADPARSAECLRLRARELSEAHAQSARLRNRPIFFRCLVRRVAGMAPGFGRRASVGRGSEWAAAERRSPFDRASRRRFAHLARPHRLASSRARAAR